MSRVATPKVEAKQSTALKAAVLVPVSFLAPRRNRSLESHLNEEQQDVDCALLQEIAPG